MDNNIKLLAGLGNPGEGYARNRHNAGFMVIDAIAEDYGFPEFKNKFAAQVSEKNVAGIKVILLKPQTYMNDSGRSVEQASSFYKIPISSVFVLHDELDIDLGRMKVKRGGGNAGHNGLKSIDKYIGNDFLRVRLGISRPENREDVSSYVLGNFTRQEIDIFKELVVVVSDNLEFMLSGREREFMSKCASQMASRR